MKTAKRVLGLILALAIVCTALPVNVFAQQAPAQSGTPESSAADSPQDPVDELPPEPAEEEPESAPVPQPAAPAQQQLEPAATTAATSGGSAESGVLVKEMFVMIETPHYPLETRRIGSADSLELNFFGWESGFPVSVGLVGADVPEEEYDYEFYYLAHDEAATFVDVDGFVYIGGLTMVGSGVPAGEYYIIVYDDTDTVIRSDKSYTVFEGTAVPEKILVELEITSLPDKTSYLLDETLDLTGLAVTAHYLDGSSRVITDYETNWAHGTPVIEMPTYTRLLVSYTEAGFYANATFPVTREALRPQSIVITSPPQRLVYEVGDTVTLAGLEVMVRYNDGAEKAVTDYTAEIQNLADWKYYPAEGYVLNRTGYITVRLAYTEGGRTIYNTGSLRLESHGLQSISVTTPPKTAYKPGETLDLTGMVVTGTYWAPGEDGTYIYKPVTGYTTSMQEGAVVATQPTSGVAIRLNYTERGINANTVLDVHVTGLTDIYVTQKPDKEIYLPGEALDYTGIVVSGRFIVADGAMEMRPVTGYTVSVADGYIFPAGSYGLKHIRVDYEGEGQSRYVIFTVAVDGLISISITANPDKMYYRPGEAIDYTGMEVTANFYLGGKVVTNYVPRVAEGTAFPSVAGNHVIYVDYEAYGSTKSTYLTLRGNGLYHIAVSALPDKLLYRPGEALDLAGMEVTAGYAYPDLRPDAVVTGYTTTPAEGSALPTALGNRQVSVSYTEGGIRRSTSFNITVVGLSSIKVAAMPDKTVYYPGEALDYTGLKVTAVYSDGTEKPVTGYTTSTPSMTAGTKNITVTYVEDGITKTTSFSITSIGLSSIEVTTPPAKNTYKTGETLDLAGLVVTAHFSDGTGRLLAAGEYTTSPAHGAPLPSGTGSKSLTISSALGVTVRTTTWAYTVVGLSSVKVTAMPGQTVFYPGAEPDYTGLEVTATYTDGTQTAVEDYTLSRPTTTSGNKTITVSYTDGGYTRTTTFSITYASLLSIRVVEMPTKTIYAPGDRLDLTGLELTGSYSGGLDDRAVALTSSSPAAGTAYGASLGAKTVTVYAAEGGSTRNTNFSVTVATLSGLTLDTSAVKREYGVGEALDLTGLVVTALYNSGALQQQVYDYASDPADGATLDAGGEHAVTVAYGGYSQAFTVEVAGGEDPLPTSISVTPPDNTTYYVGDTLDLSGLEVTAVYANGDEVVVTDYTTIPASGAVLNTPGEVSVTVSYQGFSASFVVLVEDFVPELRSIQVAKGPTKTNYFEGDTLDLTGMEVTATYMDNSTRVLGADEYTTDPADGAALTYKNNSSFQYLMVSYTENGVVKTDSTIIVVSRIQVSSLSIATQPDKEYFLIGESFTLAGLVLQVNYNNGATKLVSEGYTSSIAEGTVLSEYQISLNVWVYYAEEGSSQRQAYLGLGMRQPSITDIEVTQMPDKTEYFVGEALDLTGLEITGNYQNAYLEEHKHQILTDYTTTPAEGAALTRAGTQEVRVRYSPWGSERQYFVTFEVTVKAVVLEGIEITTLPGKTEYFTDQALDLSGLEMIALYNNGDAVVVTDYTTSPADGAVLANVGQQAVTVSYQGFSESFTVNVEEPAVLEVRVTTPTIVESLAAYLNITVADEGLDGREATAWLKVGDELLYPVSLTNGAGRMFIPAAPAAGDHEVVVKTADGTAAGSTPLEVTAYNTDIWVLNASVNEDGFVVLVFNEAVAAKDGKFDKEVKLNGKTVGCNLAADGRTLITNVRDEGLAAGTHTFQVAGVKYPRLFPSYSFTFTTQVVK